MAIVKLFVFGLFLATTLKSAQAVYATFSIITLVLALITPTA
jgi:hypothetical protein